jgi:hypothetical protein
MPRVTNNSAQSQPEIETPKEKRQREIAERNRQIIADMVKQANPIKPVEEPITTLPEVESENQPWTNPGGMVGAIADFIYRSSVLPSIEVSLAAAITFLAAITQRAYNINGSGLNLYTVLLAESGQGKEGAARGMSKLFKAVFEQFPDIYNFVGPSDIASAPALLKHLANASKSFYAHKGEMGFWLQKMNSPKAQHGDLLLKAMIMDLFHKSGHEETMLGSIYSDNVKNAPMVKAPCLSIIGDSTLAEFYKAIDERTVDNGFVGRLLVVSCPHVMPTYNESSEFVKPDPGLVWSIASLAKQCLQSNETYTVYNIQQDEAAYKFQKQYQKECQQKEWARESPASSIWSRAHIKVLRLGAILAVGNNPQKPLITVSDYVWAKEWVEAGIRAILKRFDAGDVGYQSEGHEQRKLVNRVLLHFCNSPYQSSWINKSVSRDMHIAKVISLRFIQQATAGHAAFRHSLNYKLALDNCLKMLEEAGTLNRSQFDTTSNNGVKATVFRINDPEGLV